MSPTASGDTLLHHARSILRSVDKMGAELADHAQGLLGHVSISPKLSSIVQFLPDDLSDFYRANARVRIELEERTSYAVVKGIEEGVGDIGLCVSSVDSRDLAAAPTGATGWCWRCGATIRWRGRERVGFVDTLDYEHIGLHQDSAIYRRSAVEAAHAARDVKLRIPWCRASTRCCAWWKAGSASASSRTGPSRLVGARHGPRRDPRDGPLGASRMKLVSRDPAALPRRRVSCASISFAPRVRRPRTRVDRRRLDPSPPPALQRVRRRRGGGGHGHLEGSGRRQPRAGRARLRAYASSSLAISWRPPSPRASSPISAPTS